MMELFLLVALAIENMADILTNHEIFEPYREFFANWPILGKLWTCKYCLSWWMALFVSYWFVSPPIPPIFMWPIFALALHRIITLLIEFFDRYLNRAPTTVFIIPNEKKKEDQE